MAEHGPAGMTNGEKEAELQMELQQRDTIIQMKTDEIRRLSLENHDYENEVKFLVDGNDLDP